MNKNQTFAYFTILIISSNFSSDITEDAQKPTLEYGNLVMGIDKKGKLQILFLSYFYLVIFVL